MEDTKKNHRLNGHNFQNSPKAGVIPNVLQQLEGLFNDYPFYPETDKKSNSLLNTNQDEDHAADESDIEDYGYNVTQYKNEYEEEDWPQLDEDEEDEEEEDEGEHEGRG